MGSDKFMIIADYDFNKLMHCKSRDIRLQKIIVGVLHCVAFDSQMNNKTAVQNIQHHDRQRDRWVVYCKYYHQQVS